MGPISHRLLLKKNSNLIINFKTLPKELLKKIPLSIRSRLDSIDINELPVDIAYELKNYSEPKAIDIIIDEKVYDVKPEISIYNDFKILSTKKKTVIEYIRNYILIKKGSYPFDPTFGNSFHKHLQMLDKSVVQLMMSNEFEELKRIISSIFKTGITIVNYTTNRINNGVFVEYQLNVTVKVENEIVNLKSTI